LWSRLYPWPACYCIQRLQVCMAYPTIGKGCKSYYRSKSELL